MTLLASIGVGLLILFIVMLIGFFIYAVIFGGAY